MKKKKRNLLGQKKRVASWEELEKEWEI